jgi:hypothetical protein
LAKLGLSFGQLPRLGERPGRLDWRLGDFSVSTRENCGIPATVPGYVTAEAM